MTSDRSDADRRPVVLVTGVGRRIGIGAAIAELLAAAGWDVGSTWWGSYDARMPWGEDPATVDDVGRRLADLGATGHAVAADLEDPAAPAQVFDEVVAALGPVRALVIAHCESVDSGLLDTTVDSFDRHMLVNARATWLLIREFAARFTDPRGTGRIVALTSDHTVDNVPYGASKGALDRITLAAASELAHLGVTANVVNPGATDTGWMTSEQAAEVVRRTPLGRLGRPTDCARLVTFLCSAEGGWVNGQLLTSNGGFT